MDSFVNIKFWGVRGSTPCPNTRNMLFGGNTSCMQLRIPGGDELLIFDCGTGIQNLGNAIIKNEPLKGRIFITHPHWDHIQGFPFFKPFYDPKNNFNIHMPGQQQGGCKEVLTKYLAETFFPISLDMMNSNINCNTQPNDVHHYEGFSVEYMWANHTIYTAMYKLRIGDLVIIFAPDNELTTNKSPFAVEVINECREFFKDADVLIHDAQYSNEIYPERIGWGHSPWESVVQIAREANVKRLYLTHHDPDHDDEHLLMLDKTVKSDFGQYFDSVEFVKEGTEINLPLG